jgi:hypothetical protein
MTVEGGATVFFRTHTTVPVPAPIGVTAATAH